MAGAIQQLLGLDLDLLGEFAGGGKHDGLGRHGGWLVLLRAAGCEHCGDGKQEGAGLARARLRAAHEVTCRQSERDGVLLNGGGRLVAQEPQVAAEERR